MFTAGALIIASAVVVASTGDFTLWMWAKLFYLLGVILIIFDR